jgi:hypothetical protein
MLAKAESLILGKMILLANNKFKNSIAIYLIGSQKNGFSLQLFLGT